ncbi:DUF637 domain-containing protein [Pseudoalteromonas sp. DL2-H2.2]|uniref:DUF637 domain-containing protein n=1 Tax=Pseudoalteromonas sp. DL2-H2.2 TaxID=2908889 RepID=UPI001F1D8E41|nr:DUF637 domain-containing protein [Pseudoalteromonas sp. DL2-H2.2]MCF2910344.1 DUF637 domain-containing protein [Pseudoalteromonas sp. DL2-H2.2]
MNKNETPDKPVPFYKKAIAYVNIFMLLGQMSLPTLAYAYNAFDKLDAAHVLNSSPTFTKTSGSQTQYVKSEHIVEQARAQAAQTIAGFHQTLLKNRKHALPAPQYIPIMNGRVKVILPNYPLAKQVGDRFVQTRLIRSQIYAELGRNLISSAYADETDQIIQLYQNAYELAGKGGIIFGEKVSKSVYDSFGKDFIWPELREINGEQVLSPVVHLSATTIETRSVNGHLAEFTGSDVNFRDITVNSGTLRIGKNTYLRTARDLTVNPGAQVASDGDLNLFVGGTLRNHSGNLSAAQNVRIIAGQYEQKTLVHRFSNRYEQGTRFGQIASVNGENISIYSMGDLVVQGGTISGNNISLRADGNIRLLSQQTSYVNNAPVGKYDHTSSEIEHLTTKLSANDSIYLMASGAIELKAAELHADQGVIDILAGQGVYILNEFNQSQSSKSGKWGKTTEEEQEFQTIAIRSALEAGKGVRIASEFGDITLKATQITSGTGTSIDARNGRVNLLLATEQDHYFYNKVKKGTWKIKTETIQDTVDTAVYNEIIGGVKVHATHGVTLELGQYEGETLQDTLNAFSGDESLSWMSDLHNDPEFAGNIDLAYKKLVEIHKHENKSTLSPAAMAIIAIAVSVAMGPAGAGWIGTGTNAIGPALNGMISGAAMQAGAVTLATQAATSIANGEGLDGAMKKIYSSEGLRSLAISMATAGVLNSEAFTNSPFFGNADVGSVFFESQQAIDIANQATQALVTSTVRAGISTIINGGDLASFKDQFVSSLGTFAVNELSKTMAEQIKAADFDTAIKYVAHAAAGCVIGLATAEAQNQSGSSKSCGSGALGGVVGEYVGELTREEIDARIEKVKRTLGTSLNYANDPDLTQEDILSYWQTQQAEILNLRAAGIDIAKLMGGLSALLLNADVNIAANASENAAEHNALGAVDKLVKALGKVGAGIVVGMRIVDTVDTGRALIKFGKALKKGNKAEAADMLAELATDGLIDLTLDRLIPGNKHFEKAIQKLREKGKHLWADDLEHYAKNAPGGKLKGTLEPGKYSAPKSDVPIDPWLQGVDTSKAFSGNTGVHDDLKKHFPNRKSDEDVHHVIPWTAGNKHELIKDLDFNLSDSINGKVIKANRAYKEDLKSDKQLHGAHPRYNKAMTSILDEIHASNHSKEVKREMLIEVIERAKIHLEMNEPPLMKKHGATEDKWIKVLRPAIDRRRN